MTTSRPQPPDPYESDSVTSGLPHSREAEEAVIGAIMINPEVYYDVAPIIQADDLYLHRLRFIWQAYERLQKRQVPIDSLTVSEELGDMGRLEEIGGPAYLTALLNQVPTTLHSEYYAEIVKGTSTRRKLLIAANTIATLAYDETIDTDTVLTESESAVFGVLEKSSSRKSVSAKEVVNEFYDDVDMRSKNKMPPGILTGYVDLDSLLGGLIPGKSILVAGRPGQGKTALLLNIVKNAQTGKSARKPFIVYNGMESTPKLMMGRLAAIVSEIDSEKFRRGTLDDNDWPAFNWAIEVISDWTLEFIDERDPVALFTEIKRRKRKGECDLLINDYIGKFEAKADNRVRQVGIASSMCSKIGVKLDIPVLTAAQVSRTIDTRGKDSELVLSDLKETGDLEQDADAVLFINPDPSMTNVKHCHLAKNRDGKVGRFDLIYKAAQTTFCNAHVREVSLKEPAGYLPYRDDSGDGL